MDKDLILTVSRWLGLFPFNSTGHFSLRLSLYSFTLILLLILTYGTAYLFFYHLFVLSGYPSGFLLSTLDIFQAITSLSGYVVHYGLTLKNKFDLSELMECFGRAKPRKSQEIYILCVGVCVLISSTISTLEGKCDSMLCLLMVSIDIGLMIQFVILLQFLSFVQYLKTELVSIKSTIDVDRHEQLVAVGGLINSLFGWQLLIFLLNFVASFIIEAYELVVAIREYTDSRDFHVSQMACAALMLGFHLMELIYMCDVCSSTSIEVSIMVIICNLCNPVLQLPKKFGTKFWICQAKIG